MALRVCAGAVSLVVLFTELVFTKPVDGVFRALWLLPCGQSLSAQPISIQKAQSREKANKPLRTSWMCRPCLIIIKSCYFDHRINEPFTCSRCVICVSCSVHVISAYCVRKGSGFFYLNYPRAGSMTVVWYFNGSYPLLLSYPQHIVFTIEDDPFEVKLRDNYAVSYNQTPTTCAKRAVFLSEGVSPALVKIKRREICALKWFLF